MDKVISNAHKKFELCDLSLLFHVTNAHNNFELHLQGADPSVEMSDELRCVSQGFNRDVMKYEKYDVNGFRFHTETHQKGRANPKR